VVLSFALETLFRPSCCWHWLGEQKPTIATYGCFLALFDSSKNATEGIVNEAKATLKRIESSDAKLDGGSDLANFGIVELLGCIQKSIDVYENDSARSASTCSEHVINLTDYELAFLSEARDPLSHPEMVNEISRQNNMLSYLNENDLITEEDKNRFRY